MQTEHAPQGHPTYLTAPLSLEISIGELGADVLDVLIKAKAGRYTIMNRGVRVRVDAFDSVPADVFVGLCQWVTWQVEVERQRRRQIRGLPLEPPPRCPQWPSPEDLPSVSTVRRGRISSQ